jgi:hypothetical protein
MVICDQLLGVAFHPKESYFSILTVHFSLNRCGVKPSTLRCIQVGSLGVFMILPPPFVWSYCKNS